MAFTPNQINDIHKDQLGRPATDFEIKKHSTSSIQDLANLKDTHAKLNPNSIVDYLTSVGQDSSLQNRTALGAKYGITNIGTAEGNTALLNSLKSGKTADTGASVGGSIKDATPPAYDAVTGLLTDYGRSQGMPEVNAKTPATDSTSSTTDASSTTDTPIPTTDPNTPPRLTGVDDALKNYQNYQSQVIDIDNSIKTALQNKRDEIARSGGIVDESQLKSIVLAENAPLIAQRNTLVAQQGNAGKFYQDMLNRQKESDANFYKSISASQSATKIKDTESKNLATETLADKKFEAAGFKPVKVNVTDSAGNVLGQKIVTWQNPAIALDNKEQFTTTSSGNGGISKSGVTNLGNTTVLPKLTIADGATPEQVLNSLISGKSVPVKGSTVPLSQQDLYNLAIQDMMGSTTTTGGRIPSGAILAVKDKETDIMNAYGLTPFDISIAKKEFAGMTSANTSVLQRAAFTKAAAFTANVNLQNALDQSKNVPRGGKKIANKYEQWVAGNFTPAGDLAEFETYIYTAAREYAKVTSGGAASSTGLTDTATSKADELINAAQAPEVFSKVIIAMQKDMKGVTAGLDQQTNSFSDSVKKLYGIASGDTSSVSISKGSMDAKSFVEKALTSHNIKYDDVIAQYKPTLKAGETLALDNDTGDIIAVTSADDKSKYTPL